MPRKHTSLPGGVSNPCLPSDTLRYEPLCYQGFVSVFLIFVIIRDMERNKMVERKNTSLPGVVSNPSLRNDSLR